MHTPVFLSVVIDALNVRPGRRYIDGTGGEGGHTRAILEKGGSVLVLDWDDTQCARLQSRFGEEARVVCANYADIEHVAHEHDLVPVDGVVLDLGLSMRQLSDSGRGFSYKKKHEPLDMRISPHVDRTATDVVTHYSFDELYETFARYSEELNSRRIVETIVESRRVKPIHTVGKLCTVIDTVLGYDVRLAERERTYARIFQALRIEVNDEYGNIRNGMSGAMNILVPGGKLVILTFHSLEDRIVKQYARKHRWHIEKREINKYERASFERSAMIRVITK